MDLSNSMYISAADIENPSRPAEAIEPRPPIEEGMILDSPPTAHRTMENGVTTSPAPSRASSGSPEVPLSALPRLTPSQPPETPIVPQGTPRLNGHVHPWALDPDQFEIVALARAPRKHQAVDMKLSISAEQGPSLGIWKDTTKDVEELMHSLCFSLVCYDAKDWKGGEFTPDAPGLLTTLLPAAPRWPVGGHLWAHIKQDETTTIPLSPPLILTEDTFFDISTFIHTGDLTITVQSYGTNRSNYLYVLYAHKPTPLQLKDRAARRQKDKEWQAYLAHLARPFTMPSFLPDLSLVDFDGLRQRISQGQQQIQQSS